MSIRTRMLFDFVAVAGVAAVFVYLLVLNGTSTSDLTIWTIVLIGAAISSIAGFAFAAVTGALLFQATDDKVYALQVILISSIALQSYCVWQLRRSIDPSRLVAYFGGGLLTVLPGIYLFLVTPVAIYLLLLGTFLVGYSAFNLKRLQLRLKSDHVVGRLIAGALGGITGATAGFPGAFVTIWCGAHGWEKERQRATYQPFILGMQLLTLVALATVGAAPLMRFDAVKFAAPALIGAYFGWRMFECMNTNHFNVAVTYFLLLSGFALFMKGLLL